MKMKELEARSGVSREAIRFYIREGLLPEPERPKRNVARYSEAHVIALKSIKRLQEERFLPLQVIKALMNAQSELAAIDPAAFPALDDILASRLDQGEAVVLVPLDEVCERTGLTAEKIEELSQIGVLSIRRDGDGRDCLGPRSMALAERWGKLQEAGFHEDNGFTAETSRLYVEFIDWLADQEVALFYRHLAGRMEEAEAALAAEQGIKLVNEVLGLMRTRALLSRLHGLKEGVGAANPSGDRTKPPR